ncbi:hypothetical protein [Cellulomonas carbonis]|uniref:Uncharacterized protein n=1 Tax=Cellulomonas carbonis T26 TaxID=947969 RepID=A0A0A0BLK8_9CELL|nr:hypothetical protein [Cellulomonas carbonis]KGM08577.1 hypothetical protein N868_07665 [Cellulomonas carbonis T26]GGC14864.1 hypothetical protein GCM10010972_30150 [Cellulomonas carbonis]
MSADVADRHALRRRRLGAAGAVVASGAAALWTVVVPERAETATGLREVAIRYGHPVCWGLLAVVGLLVALDAPKRVRDAVAYAAGASYAAFLLALVT